MRPNPARRAKPGLTGRAVGRGPDDAHGLRQAPPAQRSQPLVVIYRAQDLPQRGDGQEQVFHAELVEFVEFVVRDDGPGILPEFHDKIFQLFQTLKRRDEVEGTGMGLAIVKKLVERQHCRITVHSQGNGTGTQFRFRWPTLPSTIYDKEATNA